MPGVSVNLRYLHSWAYPNCPILIGRSVCQDSQRKLDVFPGNAAQINIHILQRAVTGICPFTERPKNARFLVVQLELDISQTASPICFSKETNLCLEMFTSNNRVSRIKPCHHAVVHPLRMDL